MPSSPSPRLPQNKNGQGRARKTLDDLCEAGCRILETGDRSDLTTQRVAEVSGYGIGTVYDYFSNREKLLETLAARELERMLAVAGRTMSDWAAAPIGAILNSRRLVAAMIDIIGERPRLGGILRTEMINAPSDSELGRGLQRYHALIADAVNRTHPEYARRLQDEGSRFVVFRAISGTIQTAAVERPDFLRSEAFQNEMVRMILGFLSYSLPGEGDVTTNPPG